MSVMEFATSPRGILTLVAVVGAVLVLGAGTMSRVKKISPVSWGWYGAVNQTGGAALAGYDPMSMHAGGAVLGSASHSLNWNGATWRFANDANRVAFEAAPEKYAPAFGGFCGFAMSKGFTAVSDPTAWHVEGGQLYVFNDANFRDKWLADMTANRSLSEASWAKR